MTAILLVDDEPANLVALEAILEPLGEELVHARSGKEALRASLKQDFALVLLDVQMPEMDGFETAELLRARTRTSNVPIIFLTAISKESQFVTRGYGVGAVDYLVKPYDPDVLRSKVSVFVELAKKNAIIQAQHEELQRLSHVELTAFKERSERRFADLADSMPHLVWTANAAGHVEYTNQRWHEIASTEPAPTPFDHVLHPDDRASFLQQWASGITSGDGWDAAFRFGNRRIGYRVHIVRVVARHDRDGVVVGWVGTATENDRRARANRALRMLAEASRRLAVVFDGTDDLEGVLADALPVIGDVAMLEIDGREGKRRVTVALAPEDRARASDPRFELGLATVPFSGRPLIIADVAAEIDSNVSSRTADAAHLLGEVGVTAYMCLPLASRGRVVGALVTARMHQGGRYIDGDIEVAEDLARRIAVAVDNAALHDQGERRRVELEEANRGKDVFLATLSHELRTPLNAIVGWTDMMKNGRLEPGEIARAIDTVDRNAHALSSLVADLLDVSRIVTGSLKVETKVVRLASVVDAAVEGARPACTAKGLNLVLEGPKWEDGDDPHIYADEGRLKQVIGNLVSNAVKFTPEGGTITVRLDSEDGRAKITVADSGEGISPDLLPHVFERFRQAETAKARGLGLGLAIVKHLVTAHGGTVEAQSDGIGHGARFVVDLPITEDEITAPEERSDPDAASSTNPKLDGVRVLVVEDDPDGNELITAILERYGASVTPVCTVAAALDALDAATPDIIVSDIGLPDADGMMFIRQVRARADVANLPAIALTAYASRQDAAKTMAAGFDAHVAKPVQPTTLGATIARLVRRGPHEVRKQPAA